MYSVLCFCVCSFISITYHWPRFSSEVGEDQNASDTIAKVQAYACFGSALKSRICKIAQKLRSDSSQRVSEGVSELEEWARDLQVEARLVDDADAIARLIFTRRFEFTLAVSGRDEAELISELKLAMREMYDVMFRKVLDRVSSNSHVHSQYLYRRLSFWSVAARVLQSSSSNDSDITPRQKRDALKFIAANVCFVIHGVASSLTARDRKSQKSLRRYGSFIPPHRLAPSVLQYLRVHGVAAANRAAAVITAGFLTQRAAVGEPAPNHAPHGAAQLPGDDGAAQPIRRSARFRDLADRDIDSD